MTGTWRLSCGDALDFYDTWDTPTTIISDGAYGVGGFPGDPRTPADLPRWYEPHIAAWSAKATATGVQHTAVFTPTGLHNWDQFGGQLAATKPRILNVMNAW